MCPKRALMTFLTHLVGDKYVLKGQKVSFMYTFVVNDLYAQKRQKVPFVYTFVVNDSQMKEKT